MNYPFRLGTTSFIYPDKVLPNIEKLAERVNDIEILFFEINDPNGLPTTNEVEKINQLKKDRDLSFTLHTPLKVSLGDRDESVRQAGVNQILHAVALGQGLEPNGYVVHVDLNEPGNDSESIFAFQKSAEKSLRKIIDAGVLKEKIWVESLDYDFSFIEPVVQELGVKVVLDVGHMIRDGIDPKPVVERNYSNIRMIHWHGVNPEGKDHCSISHYPEKEAEWLLDYLVGNGYNGVLCLEVFNEAEFESSMETLQLLWNRRGKWVPN